MSLSASPYGIMVDEGHVHDIDYEDADRWSDMPFALRSSFLTELII